MFIGRKNELFALEEQFLTENLTFSVIFGHSRVGKTVLLSKFTEEKSCLFFSALRLTDKDNLTRFVSVVNQFFKGASKETGLAPKKSNTPNDSNANSSNDNTSNAETSVAKKDKYLTTWKDVFAYLIKMARRKPYLLVIDDFEFLAEGNADFLDEFTSAISDGFSKSDACIMLSCSSDFMHDKILRNVCLRDAITCQIEVLPFDYLDAHEMTPWASIEDAFRYYACIGGMPSRLALLDPELSFEENIASLYFSKSGLLRHEPMRILREELRETAVYNSILHAMGQGCLKLTDIAKFAGLDVTAVSNYLKALEHMGIIKREIPFGEDATKSRKGIYLFADQCFAFWYTFVLDDIGNTRSGLLPDETGSAEPALMLSDIDGTKSGLTSPSLDAFLAKAFKQVCIEGMLRGSEEDELPLTIFKIGSWWKRNPKTGEYFSLDIAAKAIHGKRVLVGDCYWEESFDEALALEKLKKAASKLEGLRPAVFYLFTRKPLSIDDLQDYKITGDECSVTLEDLY